MGYGGIEPRLAIVMRVRVVELVRETLGDAFLVGHSDPANALEARKLRDGEADTEQLHRQEMNQRAQSHVRSAPAGRRLSDEMFEVILRAADVAGEGHDDARNFFANFSRNFRTFGDTTNMQYGCCG